MRLLPSSTAEERSATGSLHTLQFKTLNPQIFSLALICLFMIGVFIFDIATPPDDVSVCFTYAVLIYFSIFSFRGAAYLCAALATTLSVVGGFIQPPSETLSLVFFTNRSIAVAAQWLVAFLVTTRKDTEALMRSEYEAERTKAETSRRFIDVLSHEIGTSLTMIDGQAFLLKKASRSDDVHGLAGRADKIKDAVRHIEAVIRQVQVASELDQGRISFRPVAIDLSELVTEVTLQAAAGRQIHTELTRLPEMIWGEIDMLRQVVENLLSNAIKYSTAPAPIVICGRTEGGFAVLSITDQGRGIPDDEKAKLFEPYYRASNSRGVHGAGIGLYIVERYIASHRGTVAIDSELGAGTTVTVRIPIGQAPTDLSRAPTENSLH